MGNDMGFLLYMCSHIPYENCDSCSKEIYYFDIDTFTYDRLYNGQMKEFCYCSKECYNTFEN